MDECLGQEGQWTWNGVDGYEIFFIVRVMKRINKLLDVTVKGFHMLHMTPGAWARTTSNRAGPYTQIRMDRQRTKLEKQIIVHFRTCQVRDGEEM